MTDPNDERLAVAVSDRDHIDGPADATTALVVYGDYECPHTRLAHVAIRRVQSRLSSFRYVFRHFPLRDIHPHAEHAAQVAEVAHDAGKFWAMHDHLFHRQHALADADLVRYASELSIDQQTAEQALQTLSMADRVAHDVRGGVESHVRGTPTLFINGMRYRGERDVAAIEAALRGTTVDTAGR